MGSLLPEKKAANVSQVEIRIGDEHWKQSGLPAPAAIKIDVEGFEEKVLCGMRDLVETARPVVLFEQIFLSEEQLRRNCPKGFELWFLADHGELFTDVSRRNEAADAVYLPEEKRHVVEKWRSQKPRG